MLHGLVPRIDPKKLFHMYIPWIVPIDFLQIPVPACRHVRRRLIPSIHCKKQFQGRIPRIHSRDFFRAPEPGFRCIVRLPIASFIERSPRSSSRTQPIVAGNRSANKFGNIGSKEIFQGPIPRAGCKGRCPTTFLWECRRRTVSKCLHSFRITIPEIHPQPTLQGRVPGHSLECARHGCMPEAFSRNPAPCPRDPLRELIPRMEIAGALPGTRPSMDTDRPFWPFLHCHECNSVPGNMRRVPSQRFILPDHTLQITIP